MHAKTNEKETVILEPQDLQRIEAMIPYHDARVDDAVAQRKERDELYRRSKEAVKKWDKTVLGERRKRLQAKAEADVIAEAERQRHDAAWDAMRAQEYQEHIQHAKNLMFYRDDRVRKLHSKLLNQEIAHHVKKQVEHKQQRKQVWDQWDKEYPIDSPFCPSIAEAARRKQKRAEELEQLKDAIAKQQKERALRDSAVEQEWKQYAHDLVTRSNAEDKAARAEKQRKKRQDEKDMVEAILHAKAEKTSLGADVMAEQQRQMEEIRHFRAVYDQLQSQRQQVRSQDIARAEARNEQAAKEHEKLKRDREAIRQQFVEKMASYDGGVITGRPTSIQHEHNLQQEAQTSLQQYQDFQKNQSLQSQVRQGQRKAARAQELQLYQQYKADVARKQQKRHQANQETFAVCHQQAQDRAQAMAEWKRKEDEANAAILEHLRQEDKQVQEYAKELFTTKFHD